MDVYGSFQLCAVGVLAGPVTVRLSRTYFNTPGRNMIFLWTGIILAGLLSLTVEFFRATPTTCPTDEFTWDANDTSICGLTCSTEDGPYSPLRGGSQNNIYVIKAPNILPFGAVTLLAAACCIPAILSLVSMWTKIQKVNWKRRFGGGQDSPEDINATIDGTNDATPAKMMNINEKLRFYLSMVEVPVFGTIVLLIIIFGERNFFSYRVSYNTEPIASVGKSRGAAQRHLACPSSQDIKSFKTTYSSLCLSRSVGANRGNGDGRCGFFIWSSRRRCRGRRHASSQGRTLHLLTPCP